MSILMIAVPAVEAEGPKRIVSMNLCTDQMLLMLVEPERIASISFLAADPAESALADMAIGIPVNYGLAEEIITAKPDLVLAGRYTTSFTKNMLRRLGYEVVEVENPDTLASIRDTFIQVGKAVGESQRAAMLLADMDRRLAAVQAKAQGRKEYSAILYDANGFAMGRPSLVDHVMTLLGLLNKAPDFGIDAYGQVPLESMLAVKPDIVMHLSYRPDAPSVASMFMQHPALRTILDGKTPLSVPGPLFTCGTPLIADAAESMARVLRQSGVW
ncbi:MAG TPA: ABC transporter substrate-binding protein [Rhodospirillaceae bacterium]|nr:hypothetical protein [Candidatus Neomarinimicrobiota bacterium]HCX14313.1 ABC transporter substrate-binding protein [Rhodospirillaceae bacterium]